MNNEPVFTKIYHIAHKLMAISKSITSCDEDSQLGLEIILVDLARDLVQIADTLDQADKLS